MVCHGAVLLVFRVDVPAQVHIVGVPLGLLQRQPDRGFLLAGLIVRGCPGLQGAAKRDQLIVGEGSCAGALQRCFLVQLVGLLAVPVNAMEVQAQLVGQREAFAQVMVHLHGQPHLRIVLVRDAGVLRVLIAAGGKGVLVVADGRRIAIDERGIVVLSAIGIGCARALVHEGNALRSIAAADCIGVVGQPALHHVAVPIIGGIEHGGQLRTADAVLIHGLGGSLQAFGGNVPGLIEIVPVPCGGGIPLIAGVAVFVGQRLVYQRLAGFPPFRNFPLVASGMKNAVVRCDGIHVNADAEP